MLNSKIVNAVSSLILAGFAVFTVSEIHSIRKEGEKMNRNLDILLAEAMNSNYQLDRIHHKLDLIDIDLTYIGEHTKS